MSTISASTTTTTGYVVTSDTTGTLVLQTGASPTTAVTIDGSQNVGIGTSSPSRKLEVQAYGAAPQAGAMRVSGISTAGSTSNQAYFEYAITGGGGGTIIQYQIARYNSGYEFATYFQDQAVWRDNGTNTERMRIDSSGNLLVGTVSTTLFTDTSGSGMNYLPGNCITVATNNANANIISNKTTSNTAGAHIDFRMAGVGKGSITPNGTTGTNFNTTSDYRLKENVSLMTGALERVASLRPVTYTWIEDGSAGEGFIAHELQVVCPSAVTGEKDAVNEDGSIKPQGIDTSHLVGLLTAAIQEQQALIQTLTQRIETLEAK